MPVYQKGECNVLHIHTPKTGGTSIRMMFDNSGYNTTKFLFDKRLPGMPCVPAHFHKEELDKRLHYHEITYIFSVYRDPIERVVSNYRWLRKLNPGDRKRLQVPDLYAKDINEWFTKIVDVYEKNNFTCDNHIRPQCEFFVEGCDVYDYNNLSTLKVKLATKVPLGNSTLGMHNKSPKREERDVLSNETIELIKQFYIKDYNWQRDHKML